MEAAKAANNLLLLPLRSRSGVDLPSADRIPYNASADAYDTFPLMMLFNFLLLLLRIFFFLCIFFASDAGAGGAYGNDWRCS